MSRADSVCFKQAHLDAAGLLIKNVHRPLQEVASHKTSQTRQLIAFRELLENLIQQTESNLDQVLVSYLSLQMVSSV